MSSDPFRGNGAFVAHDSTNTFRSIVNPVIEKPSPLTVASSDDELSNPTSFYTASQEVHHGSIDLLEFLKSQKSCLKCTPEDFYNWLMSQDVNSISSLSEAVSDDDFLTEMQKNGIKGFKRSTFKKNLAATMSTNAPTSSITGGDTALTAAANYKRALDRYLAGVGISHETFYRVDCTAPMHLQCSISTALMVIDPVLATDGYTYERHEIEAWIATRQAHGEPVSSPQTNMMLNNLSLSPNIAFRNMAREYLLQHAK